MKQKQKETLSPGMRTIYFIVGSVLATALVLFSFRWEDIGIGFEFVGTNINVVVFAFATVLVSIFAGTLLKSALLGQKRLD